jgi:hypothetical protein
VAAQNGTPDMNGPELERLISALNSQVDSTITLGSLDDEETNYSIVLTNDAALLGCFALPSVPPGRC